MTDSVDSLTEPQKACLRLLYGRLSAKEIAAELEISPDTVNQRLTAARRKLGVSRSIEAARILAEAEGAPIYDQLVYKDSGLAGITPDQPTSWVSQLPWPVATQRRPKNDLTFMQRMAAIIGLAGLCMVGSGLLLLAIHLLSKR